MLQKTRAFYYQEVFCPPATRPSSHGGDHAPLLAPSDSLVSAADPVFASWAGLHYCADHKTRESCCIDMILTAASFNPTSKTAVEASVRAHRPAWPKRMHRSNAPRGDLAIWYVALQRLI